MVLRQFNVSPETPETCTCHGTGVWFPGTETNFSRAEIKICHLREKGDFHWCKKLKWPHFSSKALKHNSQVGPTKNFVGGVKIARLYVLLVYSWTEVRSAAKQHCLWWYLAAMRPVGKLQMTPEGGQLWTWAPVSGIRSADCSVCYWISGSAELQVLWKNMLSVKYSISRAICYSQDIK